MTEQRNHMHDAGLEALYRTAGEVEPDGGLDRIIRARADEAARTRRASNRVPWLGGLVTASVAIVAIAVLLQQTPPGERLPESLAPQASDPPDAFMAPSMGAQSQQEVSADAGRALPDNTAEEAPSPRANRSQMYEQMRETVPQAESESRQRVTAEPKVEAAAPASDSDGATLDRTMVTGSRASAAAPESADAIVDELRKLIEAGRIESARDLRDRVGALHPELDLPEDIVRALGGPDTMDPGVNRE